LDVTDEKVHDGRMLNKLVNHALKADPFHHTKYRIKIKSVLADGAYDSNANFQYLEDKKIKLGIKVRKNSIISLRNNWLRNRETRLQTKDLAKWKEKRKYGHRYIAESTFSAIENIW
jgi:hypothetical protein